MKVYLLFFISNEQDHFIILARFFNNKRKNYCAFSEISEECFV